MTTGEANDGELLGKVIGGRYRVTAQLGRGGMGVVCRALDEVLGREVAVKVLRAYSDASGPELADLRARMQREARAAARIRHSGVITVHDVTEDQGLPVIVMELVEGPSLDDVLAEHGTMDPREAAAIGAKVMDALDAAHRVGVLHRDVKPGNVLLDRSGRVVLTDFGIATMEAPEDAALTKLTQDGVLVGSLDYLPPERATGQEPGPASDIWSLGMTLYAAVEGASPFRRTSVWSTLNAIVTEQLPEPLRSGALAPVMQALMAKDPAARPPAGQARRMLEAVAAGTSVSAGPAAAASTPPAAAPPTAPAVEDVPFRQPAPPPPPVTGAGAMPSSQPASPPGSGEAGSGAAGSGAPGSGAAGYRPHAGLRTGRHPGGPKAPAGSPAGGNGRDTAPLPSRHRSRATIAAAAAAVVLAGGGMAYALVGTGGTNDDAHRSDAAPSASTASDQAGMAGGGADATSPNATSSSPSVSSSRTSGSPARPSGGASASGAAGPSAPGSSTAGHPSSASPTTTSSSVSTSCDGWKHQDPHPGTYGYMTGTYHLKSGPYAACSDLAVAQSGAKVWYHCYVLNSYGHTWTYVRIGGTSTAGWMVNDHLTKQTGPATAC